MLTDDEILDAINNAPMGQGAGAFVLAVGRAIEAKVLEKVVALPYERLFEIGQRHGVTSTKVEAILRNAVHITEPRA